MIDTNDLEIELLGELLFINSALAEIKITRDSFASEFHARIFDVMLDNFNKKGSFSLADFSEWSLAKNEHGDTGLDYIRNISHTSSIPTVFGIKDLAEKLLEVRQKDRLLDMCAILQQQFSNQSYAEMAAMMLDTLQETCSAGIKTDAEVRTEILDSLSLPLESFPVGLESLDRAMGGGLFRGFTYGFCGAEKAGKTTLAHTIGYNLDKIGCKHLYIAMEMGSAQIKQRNLARDFGVNSLTFLNNRDKIMQGVARATDSSNIFWMDAPGATLQEIFSGISEARIKHGIKGFILDYWQLVSGHQKGETEEKFLRDVAQQLANYARKHGLWCILLAQMNQDGKLFGGNGLRKACDQLFMIEQIEDDDYHRWLRMDASRYTLKGNVGSELQPSLRLNSRVGPYFEQA